MRGASTLDHCKTRPEASVRAVSTDKQDEIFRSSPSNLSKSGAALLFGYGRRGLTLVDRKESSSSKVVWGAVHLNQLDRIKQFKCIRFYREELHLTQRIYISILHLWSYL